MKNAARLRLVESKANEVLLYITFERNTSDSWRFMSAVVDVLYEVDPNLGG